MIRHLFKLIWNRKKNTILLITEVFLSFLILFGILSVFYYNYAFYTEPLGFDYNNLWHVRLNWNSEPEESAREKLKQLDLSLQGIDEIENFSFCTHYSYPYTPGGFGGSITNEAGNKFRVNYLTGEPRLAETLKLSVVEGRWFDQSDETSNSNPTVINRLFEKEYFGEEGAVGKHIIAKNDEGEITRENLIIGVIDHYKFRGEFENERALRITPMFYADTSTNIGTLSNIMLRVKPGTTIDFEETLTKHIVNITKGWNVKIDVTENTRRQRVDDKAAEILVPSGIAFFLIINVALGIMGVLWYGINRRKSEIGLRRAAGAAGNKISIQIILEALILGTFALIIGIMFAIQVPILRLFNTTIGIYLAGILTATFIIYILITICALYPSILASRIQPADALHDD